MNWKKDRGRNPNGSERVNDIHLSLAEKRAALGRLLTAMTTGFRDEDSSSTRSRMR